MGDDRTAKRVRAVARRGDEEGEGVNWRFARRVPGLIEDERKRRFAKKRSKRSERKRAARIKENEAGPARVVSAS